MDTSHPGKRFFDDLAMTCRLGVEFCIWAIFIPFSVANSLTICPPLPPSILCSPATELQLIGLLGQLQRVFSNFSVSQETFSKFGECFFCHFGCGGLSSGVAKDCASRFQWYFLLDSPSVNRVMVAFSTKLSFTFCTNLRWIFRLPFFFSYWLFFPSNPIDLSFTNALVRDVLASSQIVLSSDRAFLVNFVPCRFKAS